MVKEVTGPKDVVLFHVSELVSQSTLVQAVTSQYDYMSKSEATVAGPGPGVV